jgi:hypothetical protein
MRVTMVLDVARPGETVLFIDSVAQVAGLRFSLAKKLVLMAVELQSAN